MLKYTACLHQIDLWCLWRWRSGSDLLVDSRAKYLRDLTAQFLFEFVNFIHWFLRGVVVGYNEFIRRPDLTGLGVYDQRDFLLAVDDWRLNRPLKHAESE